MSVLYGSGTLSITNGGSVSVAGPTSVGTYTGASGTINFGTNGGTLTTQSLLASPTQLTGTGTINTCGLVSNVNLKLDLAHGLMQTFLFHQSGQNVTVDLAMAPSPSDNGALGTGWKGGRFPDDSGWDRCHFRRRIHRLRNRLLRCGDRHRNGLDLDQQRQPRLFMLATMEAKPTRSPMAVPSAM